MHGVCNKCKGFYQPNGAVPHPCSANEMLCPRCGFELFLRRMQHSLWFAFCGGLFGWSIASARIRVGAPLLLVALTSSYASWATFWGWHTGGKNWSVVYHRLHKNVRSALVGIVLLLFMRVLIAGARGMLGGAIRQNREALRLLFAREIRFDEASSRQNRAPR